MVQCTMHLDLNTPCALLMFLIHNSFPPCIGFYRIGTESSLGRVQLHTGRLGAEILSMNVTVMLSSLICPTLNDRKWEGALFSFHYSCI